MNTLIKTLNVWSDQTLHLAWPILWQSSLLIVVLFVADFALRRRVRAAVRYALWLVVLLKLLLPPSLALPTSAAWWILPRTQINPPPAQNFRVTYSETVTAPPPMVSPAPLPPEKLSWRSWMFATATLGSLALLAFLVFRWRKIIIELRRTESAPVWANELFDDTRNELRLRRNVRLRLTNAAMSPAVCGLLRPTIILPRALLETLQPSQLRAVLFHELIHLRRGDVWVNCSQTLLQIVYWWHPLLWLANARIRRVREEAVDDAVMLTLRNEGDHYAMTLLEVGKLAFARPLASLGLIGILESRSALRQRVERLMNFRPPRTAGLTLTSVFAVVAFAVVSAPMSQSPDKEQPDQELQTIQISAGETVARPMSITEDKEAHDLVVQTTIQSSTSTNASASTSNQEPIPLYVRTFKVDTNAFLRALAPFGGLPPDGIRTNSPLQPLFESIGVKLQPPKAIFYKDRAGTLLVRGSLEDLDAVEAFIQMLNETPPQVIIEAKFVEIPERETRSFYSEWFATNVPSTDGLSGILTAAQMKKIFASLTRQKSVKILSSPQITTASGRQAKIQIGDMKTIVTGLTSTVSNAATNFVYETKPMQFGLAMDVTPTVSADGLTIQLTATPTVTEFLGYTNPKEYTTKLAANPAENAGLPLPHYRVRQLTSSATVLDGQTLVLGQFYDQIATRKPDGETETKPFTGTKNNVLVVFITPTLIDSSGKRVHSNEEANTSR